MKQICTSLICGIICVNQTLSQKVNIPDTSFLYALFDTGVDTNGDSMISYQEAEAVTTLDVSGKLLTGGDLYGTIENLTGIEAFINLDSLILNNQGEIMELDLSNNTKLTYLSYHNSTEGWCCGKKGAPNYPYAHGNLHTTSRNAGPKTINISSNRLLKELNCSCQYLSSLDLSQNRALTKLLCASNAFTSLDLSNNTGLRELGCWDNQITSLDLSACKALEHLVADATKITSLDISGNTSLSHLSLRFMEDLQKVCVWTTPFPDEGMQVITTFSPNIYFTTECSEEDVPSIMASDTSFGSDFVEAASTEDGRIYLVPDSTDKAIAAIRRACIDSVDVVANTPVKVPLSGLDNGVYWLYVRDIAGNLSEPEAFTILGVGIENNGAEHIKIYPVPTNHFLTIETGVSSLYRIRITTLSGFLVFNREMEGATHQIDLSSLQKGTYFITIRSKDFVTTRKIINL